MSTVEGGGNIINSGLVLYLDAANIKSYPGAGVVWSDLSKDGNNGILSLPTFINSNRGYFVFDGLDDVVTIPDSESFALGNNNFTYAFWINFTNLLNNRTIISQYNASGVSPLWVGRIGGNISVYASSDGVNWGLSNILGFAITAGVWMNIVITRSGNTWTSYLNGSQMSTLTASLTLYNSTNNLVIAGRPVSGDGYHACSMSNIKIYNNRALSSFEVLQNYNALKGRYGL